MGVEKLLRPELRSGAFVGAGSTHNGIDPNNDATDSNLGFAGAYARYAVGASFLDAALQGGTLHSATSRLINNNLAPNGLETATGSYNGRYVSPELTLGHRFALGALLDPAIFVGGQACRCVISTQASTTIPRPVPPRRSTAGSRTTQNVEERAEVKLTRITPISPTSQVLINLSGGALGVQRVGGDAVKHHPARGNRSLSRRPARIMSGVASAALAWSGRPATSRYSSQANILPGTIQAPSSAAGAASASGSSPQLIAAGTFSGRAACSIVRASLGLWRKS